MLRGRRSECDTLDGLLGGVRSGRSAVLVVRGEAGVGKTALLDYAVESAPDLRVVRAAGVESEMELPFAALHQLCGPILDRLERLPGPQRDALGTAFGLRAGPAPERFLVGVAALSLLSEAASERPLVCVVDDAQWLDRASAQALAFAARRLLAEPVLVVFATREPASDFRGLPELKVESLRDADARELLDSVVRWPLDERVRERIVAETRGNPLALLELPRGLSPAELAGGFALPGLLPLTGRIEESFLRRAGSLPGPARRLLVVAAADPSGDPALVWRAAARLGIPASAAGPAAEAGLLGIGARVVFRHPLVRSAAYQSAALHDRQEVHRALAEATDSATDPDRRAWHRAQSTPGPDEDVAAELERSADRAQDRGGLAAAAAFLERAATLTPEPARRARRLLAAARAKRDAGAYDTALGLLAAAGAGPPDELRTAEVERLRGQIAFEQQRGGSGAAPLLVSAARRLQPLNPGLARETHLEALGAAIWAGDLDRPGGVREAAEAARAAPPGPEPPRAVDVLLDAFAIRLTQGYAAAAPAMTRALEQVLALNVDPDLEIGRWLWLTGARASGILALELWDAGSWHALAARQVRAARDAGALAHLQFALNFLARTHLLAGELNTAAQLLDEERLIAEATGNPPVAYAAIPLTAWQGREAEAAELIAATRRVATARGAGVTVNFADYASSVLCNGLGRHDAARDAAWRAFNRDQLGYGPFVVPELAEAASRTGDAAAVTAALEWLSERTRVTPAEWALGMEARVRALLSEGEAAERCYRESIERLGRTRARAELARAHLLYGEWLRRENRRVDARAQLRTAYEMLTAMGAEGFAERARRELLATGETVRKRTSETGDQLTPQEAQIARLARDGRTNPEISTQLFLSPRTVEWHLRKVFTKLGISSRRQLRQALPDASPRALPA
jgi:DNA-binding CsgD family transcriptional regulator